MKRGGKVIYSGPLRRLSCNVIQYFEVKPLAYCAFSVSLSVHRKLVLMSLYTGYPKMSKDKEWPESSIMDVGY